MKAVAPTTFARMSESLMSRKPLHKRLSRGLATCRSLPPIVGQNWRQQRPDGSSQGCEIPDVSLLDDGQQGPFGPPAWLQEAGEVAPLPQPRDSQRNGADPGVPVPEAVPVTVVGALGGTFIASGADLL